MTDPSDQPAGPDLSPEDEAAVRRLLADSGGPVTTPPEVVARLDATLADLVAEREEAAPDPDASADTGAGVVTLAARRRRWPTILLAAAALVVGGYAVGNTVMASQGGEDSGSAAGSAAESYDSAQAGGGQSDGSSDASSGSTGSDVVPSPGAVKGQRNLATYNTFARHTLSFGDADFEATVRRVATATDGQLSADTAARGARPVCASPPSTRKDTWYDVRYRGARATLVVGPVHHGSVTASVYSCDGTTLLRLAEVPLP